MSQGNFTAIQTVAPWPFAVVTENQAAGLNARTRLGCKALSSCLVKGQIQPCLVIFEGKRSRARVVNLTDVPVPSSDIPAFWNALTEADILRVWPEFVRGADR